MSKRSNVILVLAISNVVTLLLLFLLYASMKIGKATLDEELHHHYLTVEKYNDFILREILGYRNKSYW
ncbi:hypothetical protein [Pleionea litopenaei]|uniref:Uncharacterized protein n=1 Tax=Pleionea litopenaei TaxID=3070815 RepID=A0AA51RTV1_9GAMM|nr:hypothetical protein [Pleionea sp. HL-JVS1]WMS87388.1 hypothetical protein Q9312_00310 [Pleionea sp. HL-JVS1]